MGNAEHGTYEIIDAHTHVYPDKIAAKAAEGIGQYYDLTPHHKVASVDGLLAAGSAHGVTGFLVCSVATNPQQIPGINAFLSEQCALHPAFIGFGAMHPAAEDPAAVIGQIQSLGLRGVKLHPDIQQFDIDSREAYRIYEAAQGTLPILMHMGDARFDYSHPRRLKKVLEDFPRLEIIAAHLGGWSVWSEARSLLHHDNVWFDTSSSFRFMSAQEARQQILAFGAQRCFFGTDYPVWGYEQELELFFRLGLSHEENAGILAGNIKKFLA